MTDPQRESRGIPSMTGVDHVAYNVPDMEQALAFFSEVLGCELLDRQLPHAFSLDAGTSIQTAVLRYDEHIDIELLEHRYPGQDTSMPDFRDAGGYHLALTVTDVPAAVAYLRAMPGVAVREAPPLPNGRQRAFFTTPWGMHMQIIEPAGETVS
jgi:catechol 2,3-dioxygenase-like lactoylglutathione lyase family enzyme